MQLVFKNVGKSLTQTKGEFSNTERELLAVLFACEKLHTYIFEGTINSDHKPLETIFKKPISLIPSHLQRMPLRLRMYNLNMKYFGAKSVLLADTPSRLVKSRSSQTIPDLDLHIAQVKSIRPTHLQSLQAETKADPTMSQVVREAVWSHNLYAPFGGRIDFVTIQPSDFQSRAICVRGGIWGSWGFT